MNLENIGVIFNSSGVQSNQFLQASVENIYSSGDITTQLKLKHTASLQESICIQNMLDINFKKII